MENALVAVVCIALLLFAGVAVIHSTLSAADTISSSWKEMETRYGEIARTAIDIDETAVLEEGSTLVKVTIANEGQESLHDFDKWDVMSEYYDDDDVYHVVRVTYDSEPLDDNEWTVSGIYLEYYGEGHPDNKDEAFEPNILNPGEEMVVEIKLPPAIKGGTDFLVAVATPNGVTTSRSFSAPA